MRKMTVVCFVLTLLCGLSALRADDEGQKKKHGNLEIRLASIYVDDQEHAQKFYSEILGFEIKADIQIGKYKWLTVVSPDNSDGTELLLEPNANPAAETYQKACYEQEIPATTFFVKDVVAEYNRLKKLGVKFKVEPTKIGPGMMAMFDDTCGNLIQISTD